MERNRLTRRGGAYITVITIFGLSLTFVVNELTGDFRVEILNLLTKKKTSWSLAWCRISVVHLSWRRKRHIRIICMTPYWIQLNPREGSLEMEYIFKWYGNFRRSVPNGKIGGGGGSAQFPNGFYINRNFRISWLNGRHPCLEFSDTFPLEMSAFSN